jgi:hypothetical protein
MELCDRSTNWIEVTQSPYQGVSLRASPKKNGSGMEAENNIPGSNAKKGL